MSGKIEISRELAEDLLNPCADFATHDRLRALLDAQGLCGSHTGDSCVHCGGSGLLAAPVVERQDLLPCDVRVAPATTIKKGCKIETLMQCIELRKGQPDKFTRFKNSSPPAPVEVVLPSRETMRDLIAEVIGGDTYDCVRVWSAWGVGTMSEDDFVPFVEQEERLYELADACLDKIKELNQRENES